MARQQLVKRTHILAYNPKNTAHNAERKLLKHSQKNGRPGHPTTQGKIERWHRTLKQWLHARPRARDLAGLQDQLDEFVHAYNRRRHSSPPGISPIEAYHARDKAGPDPQPRPRPGANATSTAGSGKTGTPAGRRRGAPPCTIRT